MIHAVRQHPANNEALLVAVQAQVRLVGYVAQAQSLDQTKCIEYLEKVPRLRGRGERVAKWAWTEKRLALLNEIHLNERNQTDVKVQWINSLIANINELLRDAPSGSLVLYDKQSAPPWKCAAAEFLLLFYESFSSGKGLPFAGREPNWSYGRQEFLRQFDRQNKAVIVCVMCDESRFSTHVAGSIRTDVDHFFPKSRYPHLSIHPNNLIPVCHNCNSNIKGDDDPLGPKQERKLDEIDLPYKSAKGLSQRALLEVGYRASAARYEIGDLLARPDAGDLKKTLEVLSDIYRVPNRWSESADAIANQVFRRLRSYLLESGFLEGRVTATDLMTRMDRLVGLTFTEDMGRDPYAFASTWFLATLARELEQVESGQVTRSAFLEEVQDWQERLPADAREILKLGRRLREQLG